jgi:2-iminoacetate synthase
MFVKLALFLFGREANFLFHDGIVHRHEMPGLQIGPLGALPAVRMHCSITSRGTGRSEKSRTVRRCHISAWKAAARLCSSSGERIDRGGSGTKVGRFTSELTFSPSTGKSPLRRCDSSPRREISAMSFALTVDRLQPEQSALLRRFEALLQPNDAAGLEKMAQQARELTRQNFGRTMRMFAPLYLSNECINNCRYCGFSRDNPILRVTLTVEQVVVEARHLAAQGFRQVLLVAGEHPKFVSAGYLVDCIAALKPMFSSIALELGPMETADYIPLVGAGAEGLVVYQETYDRHVYSEMHTSGPKRDFDWRLDCPERAYAAGFRRIGIGALFGLARWRNEALALAAHTEYLLKRCWQAEITVSLPRLRPAAGEFVPPFSLGDRSLAQLVCAFRICFPRIGIVLSTREPAPLRDALASLGVTMMSSGSHTEPGGYTGQGREALHQTLRGRILPPDGATAELATGQFEISDERSPAEVAAVLRGQGLEPVWKDWDQALAGQ